MRSSLEARVEAVETVFHDNPLYERSTAEFTDRNEYYRQNKLAYKFLVDRHGNMHMGLSSDGHFSFNDVWGQLQIVDDNIDAVSEQVVVDLAAGRAATLGRLARNHPNNQFIGVDIGYAHLPSPVIQKANCHYVSASFEELPLRDESVDVAYAIESLCYAEEPEDALTDIGRCMKKDGKLIIFDGYSSVPLEDMDDVEKRASKLIYAGMMVPETGHGYDQFTNALKDAGFEVERSEDLSTQVMPTVKYLGRIASLYFIYPKIAQLVNRRLPNMVTANAASGYLMPLTIEGGLHTYNLTVARKL